MTVPVRHGEWSVATGTEDAGVVAEKASLPRRHVGKVEHHATAVAPAGREEGGRQAPARHRAQASRAVRELQAEHRTVLVAVDQPVPVGALPLAVTRDMGCPIAYPPGLTMQRTTDLCPSGARTGARDAFVIADAAHAMPHTLRAVGRR
ncbi:transposase [Streptomyces sp. NPDC006134]|uniref:IS110 family transposase n=1 Tax=Streptomyces sp. NPDC006134 TaxID=3154467 RepID=UPI0033F86546